MNLPAVEIAEETTLLELLERDFRAWMEAGSAGPRSEALAGLWERALHEPARSFLGRPGKQFRARLVTTAWMLSGGEPEALPLELPLLVEVLHAGSLIVDDVQDGSERRRGAPALHRLVGVPLAINTGNLLYCWTLDLLSRIGLPPERELELHRRTVAAMLACHQGQALDLSVRICDLPAYAVPPLVLSSTTLKAGSLMELAAVLGAVGAGGDEEQVRPLADFGRALGVALQMLDDLSGLLNESRRDKAREDLRLSRPTWAWNWLARDLDERAYTELQARARVVVAGGDATSLVEDMAALLAVTGRERVHRHLAAALRPLSERMEPSAHLTALQQEVERLERSYV